MAEALLASFFDHNPPRKVGNSEAVAGQNHCGMDTALNGRAASEVFRKSRGGAAARSFKFQVPNQLWLLDGLILFANAFFEGGHGGDVAEKIAEQKRVRAAGMAVRPHTCRPCPSLRLSAAECVLIFRSA